MLRFSFISFALFAGAAFAQNDVAQSEAVQNSSDSLPYSFAAEYAGAKKMLVFTVDATLNLSLNRTPNYFIYTSRSEIKWSFYTRKFYDCSVIKIQDGKLYPVEYQHIDESNSDFSVWVNFDWEDSQALTIVGKEGDAKIADISWPTYDPMSLQVAIMSAAPQKTLGSEEIVNVLEKGRLKEYMIRYNGEVAIDTVVPDLKIVEVSSEKKNGSGAFWLAQDFNWIPAKIRIDDVYIDLQKLPYINTQSDIAPVEFNDVPKC